MRCVNCGRKGHEAKDCRQKQNEKKDRPCFECGGIGHEARNCPQKRAKQQQQGPKRDVRALEDAPRKTPLLMLSIAGPKPQDPQLGDFLRPTAGKKANKNRFQPLAVDSDAWKSLESASVPQPLKLASVPSSELETSPGRSPLPLMRQVQPKLVEAAPGARGGGGECDTEIRSHKALQKIEFSENPMVWPMPAASTTPIARSVPAPPTQTSLHTTTTLHTYLHTAQVPCPPTSTSSPAATPAAANTYLHTTGTGRNMGTGRGGVENVGEATRNGESKGLGNDCLGGFESRDMVGKIRAWEQVSGTG